MYIFLLVVFAASIGGSWWFALGTYLPTNRPFFFFVFFFGVPIISTALAGWKKEKKKKVIWIGCIVTLILICSAFLVNQFRYAELNKSYVNEDTPFNIAAREIMPELSRFLEANRIEHYHGDAYGDEWVVLKATFTPEQFEHHVLQIWEEYTFYDTGMLSDIPFSSSKNPFVIEDYQFHVINFEEYSDDSGCTYAAVIGVNKTDSSVMYLFIDDPYASTLSAEGIVSGIWNHIGVST